MSMISLLLELLLLLSLLLELSPRVGKSRGRRCSGRPRPLVCRGGVGSNRANSQTDARAVDDRGRVGNACSWAEDTCDDAIAHRTAHVDGPCSLVIPYRVCAMSVLVRRSLWGLCSSPCSGSGSTLLTAI